MRFKASRHLLSFMQFFAKRVGSNVMKNRRLSAPTVTSQQLEEGALPAGVICVCISDTHAKHKGIRYIPPGDVLIHAGDFSSTGSLDDTRDFVEWFGSQPHGKKVFIAGNHDTTLDKEYYLSKGADRFHRKYKDGKIIAAPDPEVTATEALRIVRGYRQIHPSSSSSSSYCTGGISSVGTSTTVTDLESQPTSSVSSVVYLQDEATTLHFNLAIMDGSCSAPDSDLSLAHKDKKAKYNCVNLYGSPWSPEFCDWAFNAYRGPSSREIWEKIPTDTDVLITHGPPFGFGDTCSDGFSSGCVDLLNVLESRDQPPRVHIFGHIHEDVGYWVAGDSSSTLTTNSNSCGSRAQDLRRPGSGKTLFINASTCNIQYRPNNRPIMFHLPFDKALPATIIEYTVPSDISECTRKEKGAVGTAAAAAAATTTTATSTTTTAIAGMVRSQSFHDLNCH